MFSIIGFYAACAAAGTAGGIGIGCIGSKIYNLIHSTKEESFTVPHCKPQQKPNYILENEEETLEMLERLLENYKKEKENQKEDISDLLAETEALKNEILEWYRSLHEDEAFYEED